MQKSNNQAAPGGFSVQDVLFVVCNHKWLILLFSIIGFGTAAAVFMAQKPLYQSQAKLLVRYVLERPTLDTYHAQVDPGTAPGVAPAVITTEIEILTSADLALETAAAVGPERLLPMAGSSARLADAAGVILGKLQVTTGQSPNVIHLIYDSEDPEMAKVVLSELVKCYSRKHLEIHRSAAAFDMVSKQAEEVRERLRKTESELNTMRTESGIISLESATATIAGQRSRTQEELMDARAELAELQAEFDTVTGEQPDQDGGKGESVDESGGTKPKSRVPDQVLSDYRAVEEMLAFLRKREMEMRVKFTAGNRLMLLNREQIQDYEARRRALVNRYPGLESDMRLAAGGDEAGKNGLIARRARLAAVKAKIGVYESQLKILGEQFTEQYSIGARINEIERRKQMEETEYRSLETNLKNAKLDQALDPARMPNITVVQNPSEPIKSFDKKIKKIIMGLAGGGMALGLGLAFLIEMLFDRRVKRPIEIQARLQLPLLLTIPFIRRKERGGLLLGGESLAPRIGSGAETTALANREADGELAEPSGHRTEHFIMPYSETIRDRIIFNFEVNNVTHKPKLVAVTGLSEGAGASTIAAGLAKSFSEIHGMKVLLVDLSSYHPEDNPLFGEIPRHSLNGALHLARNTQFRETPQNLYYASATARRDESGLTTFSPVHLYELLPHLQASQYDYIVFDMPPIDQTSRTLTMAGLMDKVLLVLDAENTSRDGLMWGYSELVKGKADVSCIFNKTRSLAPGWLIGGP